MMEPSQGKQGEVIVLRVYAETEFALTGTFAGQTWPFWREGKVYWSLVGIAPWMAPGHYPLDLTATDRWGQQGRATVFLEVAPTAFPREYIELPEDKGGLLSQELLDGERVALEALLGQRRPQKLWQGLFVMPAEAGTSSAFGTRRSFSGGALSGPHLGMDIEARYGAPVVAANDGVVVLAQPLSVRGNVVIIDHGWGVYTGYFHLLQIGVPEGRVVRKGERIGLVGATGLATGPHLHWEMRVGGVPVDPLEWTRRPFP